VRQRSDPPFTVPVIQANAREPKRKEETVPGHVAFQSPAGEAASPSPMTAR
jgi:hypothetical protein